MSRNFQDLADTLLRVGLPPFAFVASFTCFALFFWDGTVSWDDVTAAAAGFAQPFCDDAMTALQNFRFPLGQYTVTSSPSFISKGRSSRLSRKIL